MQALPKDRKRIKAKVKLPLVTKEIRFELTKDLQKSDFNPFKRGLNPITELEKCLIKNQNRV